MELDRKPNGQESLTILKEKLSISSEIPMKNRCSSNSAIIKEISVLKQQLWLLSLVRSGNAEFREMENHTSADKDEFQNSNGAVRISG